MQSNTLTIHPSYQQTDRGLNRSRSIRERSQRHSSSKSDNGSSIKTRIRKASAHQFAKDSQQFQVGQEEKHALGSRHSLPLPSDPKAIGGDYLFLQSKIHDQLETQLQRLENEERLQGRGHGGEEELEQLEYTTFRIVKRQEKTHLSELRQKWLPTRGRQQF